MSQSKSEPNKRSSKTHYLSMKGTIYLENIINGNKKFEGRVGCVCESMQIGDKLKLFDNRAKWGIICKITSIDRYEGFAPMLKDKGVLNMLPQLEKDSKILSPDELVNEGVKIYQAFPGATRVQNSGAVAIGVQFFKKIYKKEDFNEQR